MRAIAALAVLLATATAAADSSPGPTGWYLYQPVPGEYATAADKTVTRRGRASGRLASRAPHPTGYGLLGQLVDAAPWHGKRIRLTAALRSADVARVAGMFLRVDGPDRVPRHALALDTMERRALRGTTSWTEVSIVLDVPPAASQLALGAWLRGAGTVWIDDVRLEAVPTSVPTTSVRLPATPRNSSFED